MPSSPLLSDKAKGKQRATIPLDAGEGSSELPRQKKLVIRFSEGVPDLTLEVAERDAVRDVKRNVCHFFQILFSCCQLIQMC